MLRFWILLTTLFAALGAAALETETPVEPVPDAAPEWEIVIPPEPVADDHAALIEMYEWLRAEGHDSVICPFRGRIDYDPGEIECGLIRVPENRERADSRTIELHFVRIAARGEDHEGNPVEVRDDPVVYLTGGPGVQLEGYIRRMKDHRLMARRDVYFLEHRGIGHSGDFCPFFEGRNRAERIRDNFEDQQFALFDAARRCVEGATAAGVDVTGYHTFENARDLRALRLALGLENWNVWGISYGAALGQAYLQVDPEGIRAMVLDAIVPLDLEHLMQQPRWFQRDLDKLFAACDQQSACREAFPNLAERYRAAITELSERPMELALRADERFPDGRTWVFQDLIAGMPFGLLYDESNHAALPAIIDGLSRAVERRDDQVFKTLAVVEPGQGLGMSMGMGLAVRCLDGYFDAEQAQAARSRREHPLLAGAFWSAAVIEAAPRFCREIGLTPRDPATFALVDTEIPVLVANGAWDPITPPPLAEYILPSLKNSQYLEFPHAGHGPTRSVDCAGDLLNDYFDDPAVPVDTTCAEAGGAAANYIAPYYRTRAIARGLRMHDQQGDRLIRHAAWGGGSLGLTFLGFVVLLFAWLARRVNFDSARAAGGSRLLVALAAATALGHVGGLGFAAWTTAEVSQAMLLFGLVPWASQIAWLAPVSVLFAILGFTQTLRSRHRIERATRFGLLLTCLAVVSLAIFTLLWDLWPL